MPWREDTRPYYIWLSELMLQQTQVSRVVPKFEQFIARFPDVSALSRASLAEVLEAWNGLGYNRRAKFLWQAAIVIMDRFAGVLPSTYDDLVELPGIGPNTAGAILAYAYNQPVVFVETNIRSVYLHYFFSASTDKVADGAIRDLVQQTLDMREPREWYWALMDYGTYLKTQLGSHLEKSAQYKKQSRFEGSLREVRGRIIRALLSGPMSAEALRTHLNLSGDARFDSAVTSLQTEQLIMMSDSVLGLTDWSTSSHNESA